MCAGDGGVAAGVDAGGTVFDAHGERVVSVSLMRARVLSWEERRGVW